MSGDSSGTGLAKVDVELKIGDRQLRATMSVPAARTRLAEMLPIVQRVADAIVDTAVQDVEQQGRRISCKMGCGACCRQLVPISQVEARRIADVVESLPPSRREVVKARFDDARRRLVAAGLLAKLVDRDSWQEESVAEIGIEYFNLGIACPFLEDESCSIHVDRPVTCREYLVTSPAVNCASPRKDNIEQVELPARIWTALARFDATDPSDKFCRWVPLVLAPEWAASHPDDLEPRTGPEMLREFFGNLAAVNAQATSSKAEPHEGTSFS